MLWCSGALTQDVLCGAKRFVRRRFFLPRALHAVIGCRWVQLRRDLFSELPERASEQSGAVLASVLLPLAAQSRGFCIFTQNGSILCEAQITDRAAVAPGGIAGSELWRAQKSLTV